jgi:hypothetical protein
MSGEQPTILVIAALEPMTSTFAHHVIASTNDFSLLKVEVILSVLWIQRITSNM